MNTTYLRSAGAGQLLLRLAFLNWASQFNGSRWEVLPAFRIRADSGGGYPLVRRERLVKTKFKVPYLHTKYRYLPDVLLLTPRMSPKRATMCG